MENDEKGSSVLQGKTYDQPSGGFKSVKERVAELTTLQKDRFYILYDEHGESSFEILDYFKGKRAPNQWTDYREKSKLANQIDHPEYGYLKDLASTVNLNETYDEFDVVMTVKAFRTKFSLPEFTTNITHSSVGELKRVFLINEGDNGDITLVLPLMASK